MESVHDNDIGGSVSTVDPNNHPTGQNQSVVTAGDQCLAQHQQEQELEVKEASLTGSHAGSMVVGQEGGHTGKTPNSYKFPLLKKYFEFGPWIGRNRKALCLACQIQTSSSQPDRLLKHLNRCSALTESDKAVVKELMNDRTANKRRKPMSLRLKRGDNDQDDSEYYGEDEGGASLVDDISLGSINATHTNIPHQAGFKKARREPLDRKGQIDEALTKFIITSRIPLKAIHSREFVEFVRLLDPEYHIPNRETITNVLIPGLLNII